MMFPVGPQPPAVYWRRRLILVAGVVLVVVLLVLTAKAVLRKSPGGPQAAGTTTTRGSTTAPAGPSTTAPTSGPTTPAPVTTTPLTSPAGRTSSLPAAPAACTPQQLRLAAVATRSAYHVGDQPVLGLQVTNTGAAPCVQDVADSQIELRVYNGASRVWGSHDCKVEPGVITRTFNPGQPAVFTITWSGLSSQPGCAGTRQRVGVGTYTLYASLAGHAATAAQFAIS
jgi:hypothetical protein